MTGSIARSGAILALGILCCCGQAAAMQNPPPPAENAVRKTSPAHIAAKHSSAKQRGKASIYSRRLARRRMADGTPLDLESNAAASKHLPLGSRARVTNLGNGKTAEVEIKDRGPYVKGRIIDLSPQTAHTLGLKSGLAPVEVEPIKAPSDAKNRDAQAGGKVAR